MKVTIQVVDDAGNIFAGEATLDRISGDGKTQVRQKAKGQRPIGGNIKCPSAIERLWKDEQFRQALSFQAVKSALAGQGYNFPRNTLMMALQSAAFLTRRGGRGSYTWTQRHPFTN